MGGIGPLLPKNHPEREGPTTGGSAVPYRVEIVLTDNGIQFADLPKNRSGPTAKLRGHPFDRVCREHGIEHRLTKPNLP